ncbi:hypothetical protein SESBI_12661 [Sesbania bispinosa]|nr:hypothetical protein SESBI_12661 [Sesbania bispinosa]
MAPSRVHNCVQLLPCTLCKHQAAPIVLRKRNNPDLSRCIRAGIAHPLGASEQVPHHDATPKVIVN